jgi:nucleotide-binding universal stress UspA family protein
VYAKIVVPLDGSAFSEAALPYALSIGRRAGSDVELVSVAEDMQVYPDSSWERVAHDWLQRYLEDVSAGLRGAAGSTVTTRMLEGRIWEALVRHVEETDADLIVMATHGRGALSRAWLGSVADALVRHTDRPVLLVRPGEEDATPSPDDIAFIRVLVPLDGSDLSRSILDPALELGSLFGAGYDLLRVVSIPTESPSPYVPYAMPLNVDVVEGARAAAVSAMEAVAEELQQRGVDATAEVVVDPQPARVILSRATRNGGLVALATHGRGSASRMVLGSTADKVIRGASGPVLVLRPTGDA